MATDNTQTFEALKQMGLAALASLAKKHVTLESSLQKVRERFASNHRPVGKIIAAMKVLYAEAQDDGVIPKGTSFRDYHKNVTGEFPNNHAEACAVAFNCYVLTGLISEEDYDSCPSDWLERASTVYREAEKTDGEKVLENERVKKVANILRKRDVNTAAKELRQLVNESKGKVNNPKDGDEKSAVVELSAKVVLEYVQKFFRHGYHPTVMAAIIAEVKSAKDLQVDLAKHLFEGTMEASDAWEAAGLPDQTLDQWSAEHAARRQMAESMNTETPAPPAPVPQEVAA